MDRFELVLAAVAAGALSPAAAAASDTDGWKADFHWGDLDADGRADVLTVDADGAARLLWNAGDGTFEDVTSAFGLDGLAPLRFALWADVDGDGHADLFAAEADGGALLWRNDGSALTVWQEFGSDAIVRGAEWIDVDGDGRLDLHLATTNGHELFRQAQDWTFERAALDAPVAADAPLGFVVATEREFTAAGEVTATGEVIAADEVIADRATARARRTARGSNEPQNATIATTGTSVSATSAPNRSNLLSICAATIEDIATGSCVEASSLPTFGKLYPLGPEFTIDGGTGFVGINTTSPSHRLTIKGDIAVDEGSEIGFLDSGGGFGTIVGSTSSRSTFVADGGREMQFYTTDASGVTQPRMTIQAGTNAPVVSLPDGRLGIGTASPAGSLDVGGASYFRDFVRFDGGIAGLDGGALNELVSNFFVPTIVRRFGLSADYSGVHGRIGIAVNGDGFVGPGNGGTIFVWVDGSLIDTIAVAPGGTSAATHLVDLGQLAGTEVVEVGVQSAGFNQVVIIRDAWLETYEPDTGGGGGGIGGSGTADSLPMFSGSTTLANSVVRQNGTNIGIGTGLATSKLTVAGTFSIAPTGIVPTFSINNGDVDVGGPLQSGSLDVLAAGGTSTIQLDGANGSVTADDLSVPGSFEVAPGTTLGKVTISPKNTGNDARLLLTEDPAGTVGMSWDYDGSGNYLRLFGFNPSAVGPLMSIHRDTGRTGIGTSIPLNRLTVADSSSTSVARFDQNGSGDVLQGVVNGSTVFEVTNTGRVVTTALEVTGGGDVVEAFDSDGTCEPGMVVVIDPTHPGRLVPSTEPYDRKVAGAVSGAGGVRHGLKLTQAGVLEGDTLVAMTGRVYVRCTTEGGAIQPGDRLTTSSTRGSAMRVAEPSRADGAVIGKAMSELSAGTGLVLVLVNLQ